MDRAKAQEQPEAVFRRAADPARYRFGDCFQGGGRFPVPGFRHRHPHGPLGRCPSRRDPRRPAVLHPEKVTLILKWKEIFIKSNYANLIYFLRSHDRELAERMVYCKCRETQEIICYLEDERTWSSRKSRRRRSRKNSWSSY